MEMLWVVGGACGLGVCGGFMACMCPVPFWEQLGASMGHVGLLTFSACLWMLIWLMFRTPNIVSSPSDTSDDHQTCFFPISPVESRRSSNMSYILDAVKSRFTRIHDASRLRMSESLNIPVRIRYVSQCAFDRQASFALNTIIILMHGLQHNLFRKSVIEFRTCKPHQP